MSAADVLYRLLELNLSAPESRRVLDNFLRFEGYGYFMSTLGVTDVLNFVDFLDKVRQWRRGISHCHKTTDRFAFQALDAIPTSDRLWGECLSALRQICGDRGILPTTHVLARGLIKKGNGFLSTQDVDHLRDARYKRRIVHIRTLRIPSIADQDLVKKVINTQCCSDELG